MVARVRIKHGDGREQEERLPLSEARERCAEIIRLGRRAGFEASWRSQSAAHKAWRVGALELGLYWPVDLRGACDALGIDDPAALQELAEQEGWA